MLMTEIFTLSGAMMLTGLLLWISVYIVGIVMLIPAAAAWLVFLVLFGKRMQTPKLLAEYGLVSGLLAAQIGILIAILMRVLPSLAQPLANLI
jgi:hypothetical protein